MILSRTDFSVVIKDDRMMGKLWKKLSVPQQTILLAAYGLELPTQSHLAAWSMLNGKFTHDDLGYPTKIFAHAYKAKTYETIVGLVGRRSGKSYITCFAALYEIIFGGHMQKVNDGEEIVIPYIAQDLPTARKNMKMIAILAKQVPTLKKHLTKETSDLLEFFNGRIKVQIEPPMVKTGRGWAMPIVIMDEVGFWYKTAENANPDVEVYAAVTASQLQFAPHNKTFIISSPYTEEGLLYEHFRAGTDGINLPDDDEDKKGFDDTLVVCAPTACMQNPMYSQDAERRFLEKRLAEDPDVFKREYLAKFVSAIDGFLDSQQIRDCVQLGIKERKPDDFKGRYRMQFISVIDPAFRHDDFVYSIFHREPDGTVVQDYLKVWSPDKRKGIVLEPLEIINFIAQKNREWGIKITYSDQYQLESLQQHARQAGFEIIGNDFTGKSKPRMFGSLENLFKTKKIKILDRTVIQTQLSRLIKKRTPIGGIQIVTPAGVKDDVAATIALGAEVAIQLYPTVISEKKEKSLYDMCIEDMKRKSRLKEDKWESFTGFSH